MSSRKIYVCIASGQQIQNYVPILQSEFKPNEAIILASSKEFNKAVTLKNVFESKKIKTKIVENFPSQYLSEIVNFLGTLKFDKRMGTSYILNMTGGNKIMSTACYEFFRTFENCQIIYNDHEHNQIELVDTVSHAQKAVPVAKFISLDDYLNLHNLTIESTRSDLEEWRNAVVQRKSLTQLMVDNLSQTMALADQVTLAQLNKQFHINSKAILKTFSHEMLEKAHELKLLKYVPNTSVTLIDNPDYLHYLKSDWLEEYTWLCLEELGYSDVKSSLKYKSGDENINELDAVCLKQNQLFIFECKTKKQVYRTNETNPIFHRLDVISKQVAGMYPKKALITQQLIDNPEIIKRADELKIKIFDASILKNLKQMLKHWIESGR